MENNIEKFRDKEVWANEFIQTMNGIMFSIGVPYQWNEKVPDQRIEIQLMFNFLKSKFRNMTLQDLKEAFDVYAACELRIYNNGKVVDQIQHYNSFDLAFVGRILKAYKVYKAEQNQKKAFNVETKPVPQLTFDEIRDHTAKAYNLYKHDQKMDGANWVQIYQYLKKEGEIVIPEEEYKILMLELREEMELELKELHKAGRTNILLSMALDRKMFFDCECLKRVVLRYFKEKREAENFTE